MTGRDSGRIKSTVAASVNPIHLMTDAELELRIMELEAERLGTIDERPALCESNGPGLLRLAGPETDESVYPTR